MSEAQTIVLDGGPPGLAGYLGGKTAFPVPDLGQRCVCCDAEDASPVAYDPSLDRQAADPIEVPVCASCRDHVRPDGKLWQLGVVALGLGGLAALLFVGLVLLDAAMLVHWPLAASVAGLGALVGGGVLLGLRRRRATVRALGHHAFDVMVGATGCVVRTTNPRVAEEVLARNETARLAS